MASSVSTTWKMRAPMHDLLAAQARRVAGAVPLLLVLEDDDRGGAQVVDALQQRPAQLGVALHLDPLVGGERPGLEQHAVAHADLADVVEERAVLDDGQLGLGDAELLGEPARVERDAARVPLRLGVAVVERRDEPLEQRLGALPHHLLEPQVDLAELSVLALHLGGEPLVLAPQPRRLGRLADGGDELLLVPGLRDDAVDLARVHRLQRDPEVLGGGAEDADGARGADARRLEEGDAVHLRHHVVGDDHDGAVDLEGRQGLRRGAGSSASRIRPPRGCAPGLAG